MFVHGANGAVGGYNLTRSLRFRSSASGYLSRTMGTPTNNKIFTVSFWVKRGALNGSRQQLIGGITSGAGAYWAVEFNANNGITVYDSNAPTSTSIATTAAYRDPSAWYHIVVAEDTTQATASNRTKLYVNGVQVTSFSTSDYATQNSNPYFNSASATASIGSYNPYTVPNYFDGYQAEIYFVDGQALTPSSFGETDTTTGVWKPKRFAGTYGTNGFYLPFTDNSALTTSSNAGLGKDFSGNGNYWTTNNISITAGTTYDSMTDVPTLTSATAANFAVLNPLNAETGMGGTLGGGNLDLSGSGGKRSTIAARSGKWYWEFRVNSGAGANFPMSGLYVAGQGTYWPGYDGNSFGYFQGGGIYYNGSTSLTVSSYTDGDVLGFAWDADTGKVYVAKNGTWQNSGDPAAGTGQVATISTGVDRVVGAYNSSGSCSINFGQRPFTYTPPTGYVALNTFNLPTSTILQGSSVMTASTYGGTGSSSALAVSGPSNPDFVWIKRRDGAAGSHALYDVIRGFGKRLYSNATNAEYDYGSAILAPTTTGFNLTTSDADHNASGSAYVAWQWQAGQGTTSSNTSGSITSTVSVNASAGFSVAKFTAQSSGTGTFGHGLGVAPAVFFVKQTAQTGNWGVYHSSLGGTQVIFLNATNAATTSSSWWNNSAPTSTVINLGSGFATAGDCIAYCFAPIAGYSAMGSYLGNGSSDGPFVYTGHKSKFVLVKRTDSTGDWYMYDTSRDPYNATQKGLSPNNADSETSYTGWGDILSNGFKIRRTDAAWNASGASYIYISFAENPFRNSLAR